MRALNFLFIFIICLGLVLFSLQNTNLATVQLIEGVEVQAPIAIELIIATGFGAFLAWIFSLWSRLQRTLANREASRQLRQQEKRIQELETNLQKQLNDYQNSLETQQKTLIPTVEVLTHTPEVLSKEQPADGVVG
ncbi:hypothetical protein PCC9214_01647 [Planktothrix tepida]|uniref:Lipopolysaccharide assembly protein A domain-containing protein n=2 Tax=Planktothrix TaxID=54304 RepID=A0A1J1LN78_9CYAN|nr:MULTISPECIES: LapA family protein [Planktothrix]CAD5936615.1 hypothetical protein PCC9214_01647 [Planktothrix tepida]CAD5974918.1 hypothetical protein NO713_04097 [Planktothrix pseudagardhii]CUR33388.1 conserved exported hypothetical protein [Planktothrix tepida PCC 9214]